jgi:hypothetical protein
MCNDHPLIKALAARAKAEPPPEIDVTRAVLSRIREERESALSERFWAWFAAGSFVTATAVAVFCLPVFKSVTDPLYELFQASVMLP